MIHLFFADYTKFTEDLPDFPLSEYRKESMKNLTKSREKDRLLTELFLIYSLKSCQKDLNLPLNIQKGEYGKPYIPDFRYHFNLSHSGSMFFCAVADTTVGADIQQKVSARRIHPIAIRFFTENEQRTIADSPDKEATFTSLWTVKEAYLKALGTGLHSPLSSFDVDETLERFVEPEDSSFRILRSSIDDYYYAVCVEGDIVPDEVGITEITDADISQFL